ncbi:hypothetical protein [Pseudoflavonifractor phocaeensis]|uniref:hypothetical protein n=1 Tax=Pseudoflavonifractor phocaeensis TaxID=1870988 RepID=UPI00195971F0|nr:hypothetical protein [Pseudoflavonifractor phocaeensis]MBM6925997.1 hypothetical protein [Pseudoflavonifractor phocaeensis]
MGQNLGLAGFISARPVEMGSPRDHSPGGKCARMLRTMGASDVMCATLARAR